MPMATMSGRWQKLPLDQRTNAQGNPKAVFHGQPITIDDVLQSKMVADPLHVLEIVMPCAGGQRLYCRKRASGTQM